ncbi:MAG TPA: sigma-70 family RNA polymerase sigma factor, partial [Terriglobales bacterium]|nr:sigma-70 family RNA polymerase sigma factor [Terriglobales bacterium]
VHISYKLQRTPDIDKEMQHWTAKIQKRLQVFRPELVHLKGLVEQNSAREGATVSLNLRLPCGQMAAQESAPNPTSALKAAFDDLFSQITRHKDLLRNSHRWKRRRAVEDRPTPEVPFEQTIASVPPPTASAEEIHSYINTNFRRLQLFVERQLSLRENSGQIPADSVSAEEIVDEAVARALDEKIDKPDRIAIEAWFYRLAIQAMDDVEARLAQGESEVNLNGVRPRRNERASDEARMQFHQPDESMTTESGIPDRGTATPEEIAYTDEMFALVQFALEGAAPPDRETFILHALEGFSVSEIAAITDRPREQVQESIGRAREKLRQSFPLDNSLKTRLLQETTTR